MSTESDVQTDRRYTKEHEWALEDDGVIVVGITAFAVGQLGDITLVNFDVDEGARLEAGDAFGTIESVKTLSDLFSPISGEVVALNPKLENEPEAVNDDCWGEGWMIKIRGDISQLDALMDAEAYQSFIKQSD